MAFFSLTLNRISPARQAFMAALSLGLFLFIVFIEFVATRAQLLFIGANHLDKIAHTAGGAFLAVFFEWAAPGKLAARLPALLFFIVASAVLWECYEFLNPEMVYFYRVSPDLWRLDTSGDIIAAILGGYGYRVFSGSRAWQ